MEEKLRRWELEEQIVSKVFEIRDLSMYGDCMFNKDGEVIDYYDFEYVGFTDLPVILNDEEKIVGLMLFGDGCLEFEVVTNDDYTETEGVNWGNFSSKILEQVLNILIDYGTLLR